MLALQAVRSVLIRRFRRTPRWLSTDGQVIEVDGDAGIVRLLP